MKPIKTFFRIAGNAICGATELTALGVGAIAAVNGKDAAVEAVKAPLSVLLHHGAPHGVMTPQIMVVLACVGGGAAMGAAKGVIRSIWPEPEKEKKPPSNAGIILRSATLTTLITIGFPLVGGALLLAAEKPSSVAVKELAVLLGAGFVAGLGSGGAWAAGEAKARRRMLVNKEMRTAQAPAPQ